METQKENKPRASVKRYVQDDVIRYDIFIPKDEANIHLTLDEESFFFLADAVRSMSDEGKKNV
ncbi:hypothetical protein AB3N59_18695 [Leptospira sp. WS92.C1]